jgi:hypothetical protein
MFVGIEKTARERKSEPPAYVSINKRGEIVLNFAAIKLLMAWDSYTLHYDAETNRLGIRRADYSDDRTMRVFQARRKKKRVRPTFLRFLT